MPRNMSFSLTTTQFLAGAKTVTRRMGWLKLKRGDQLTACRKCMGLRRGETIERLGLIEVIGVRRERLDNIGVEDVRREGFPDMSPTEFVVFFCGSHKGCTPQSTVTRIEFRRIAEA